MNDKQQLAAMGEHMAEQIDAHSGQDKTNINAPSFDGPCHKIYFDRNDGKTTHVVGVITAASKSFCIDIDNDTGLVSFSGDADLSEAAAEMIQHCSPVWAVPRSGGTKEESAVAMGEHLAEQQPLCMAKRIEELEAQVMAMDGLLREALESVKECANRRLFADERAELILLVRRINASLTGKLTEPVVPEGWQLVPIIPTQEMLTVGALYPDSYADMLAAAPKPEAK